MSIALIIFLAIMAVGEIILAAVLFKWTLRVDEAIDEMKAYSEMIKSYYRIDSETYKESIDKIIAIDKDYIQKVHDNTQKYTEYVTEILTSEKEIVKAIHEDYVKIREAYDKIQDSFLRGEQRYSDAYDQFSLCSKELKEVKEKLIMNADLDEYRLTLKDACDTVCLDCPYNDCIEDKCPVYLVQHNRIYIRDGDDEESEMDPEEAELFREGDAEDEL